MRLSLYHSCENKFVITLFEEGINYPLLALKTCKNENIEADGLLVLKCDPMEVFIYNKDGSSANMCGNGLNSLMHFCYDKFKIYKNISFITKAGLYNCEILNESPFISCLDLGIGEYINNIVKEKIIVNDIYFEVSLFLLGVKHAVIVIDDIEDVLKFALDIFNYPLFNQEYNINFVRIVDLDVIEVITFERGVGWTKACGTGVSASAYIMSHHYGLKPNITVLTPGGVLKVDIETHIYLTAESNYIGEIEE